MKISVQDGIPKCKTSSNSDSADSTECSSDDKSFQGYDSVFYQNAYKSEDSAKQFAKQLSRYLLLLMMMVCLVAYKYQHPSSISVVVRDYLLRIYVILDLTHIV